MKLAIDAVPEIAWGKSAARTLPRKRWNTIRESVFKKAQNQCQVCSDSEGLHCDEIWELRGTMYTLIGFCALCRSCHNAKHYGRAQRVGTDREAREHLGQVNGWTDQQVRQHISERLEAFRRVNEVARSVDISYASAFALKGQTNDA